MRQAAMLLVAIVIIAIFGAGIYWALGTETSAASRLVTRSYGPDNASFVFTEDIAGTESPAAGCVVCHSVERNGPLRVAPGLWGIVGDKKARAGWFAYSPALKSAEGTWTDQDLDKYLANPSGYLPGTIKTIAGIGDENRSKIIDYLKTLK